MFPNMFRDHFQLCGVEAPAVVPGIYSLCAISVLYIQVSYQLLHNSYTCSYVSAELLSHHQRVMI